MTARLLIAGLLLSGACDAAAQDVLRRLTTVGMLREYPGYYHLQNILLHGEIDLEGPRPVLRAGDRTIGVLLNDATAPSGLLEVRGELLDVGRLEPGDVRLAGLEGVLTAERWPLPGDEPIVSVADIRPAPLETTASIRALALQPWRFEGRTVTVVGQFRGRNLYGDLPSAPAVSPDDFVLRSADAALWVTGLPPRGPDFRLSVDARVDTSRWLEVTGVVALRRGLVTLEGARAALAAAPAFETTIIEPPVPAPPAEPAEVVFSTPTEGEIGIPATTTVRIQFSRGLAPETLEGRIRISYAGGGEPPAFTHDYDGATRALELTFAAPLERLRTVRVEIGEGATAFDGAPVQPWSLTFSVGP